MKNLFRRRSEEKNDDEEDELYQFISKVKPLVDVFRPTADFFQTFGGWRPPMDVVETPETVSVTCDLPGVKKEDISVEIDNNSLFIKGKRPCTRPTGASMYSIERGCGEFERVISLPGDIEANSIKASFNHGILQVDISKSEQSKRKPVQIHDLN